MNTINTLKRLRSAYRYGESVIGTITEVNKGGWMVDVNGVSAFLPKSHFKRIRIPESIIGNQYSFRIIDLVSRAAPLNGVVVTKFVVSHFANQFDFAKLGDTMVGTVKKSNEKGLLVEVKGYIFQISYDLLPVSDPSEIRIKYPEGCSVKADVTSIDLDLAKIRLSITAYEENLRAKQVAVKEIAARLEPGSVCEAKVTRIAKEGVHVLLGDVPGFIPNKEIRWGYTDIINEVFVGEVRNVAYLYEEKGVLICSAKVVEEDKYDNRLYDLGTKELLLNLGIQNNEFIGAVYHGVNGMMFINLLASSDEDDGKLLVDPVTGAPIKIIIPRKAHNLFEHGVYYKLSIEASPSNIRRAERAPFRFQITDKDALIISRNKTGDPYRKLVEKSFYKHPSPESNLNQVKMLEEFGLNMYDSRDRMFFELLQNADDSAALEGVNVFLQAVDGYLLLSHNGIPFDRKDYASITSVARSTKGGKKGKTGYKGIGFKSVFTNSPQVYIKTGGFNFVFDKEDPIFSDFERFYFQVNRLTNATDQKDFIDNFRDEYQEFDGVESIPWQLLPFWRANIPSGLENTIFSHHSNVSIALAMNSLNKDKYVDTILGVLGDPKFMLFLRHTNRIQYKDEFRKFNLSKKNDDGITILQSTRQGREFIQKYIVNDGAEVIISDEAFASVGVDIQIKKTTNEKTGKDVYVFVDSNGQKIPSIPNRIPESSSTLISYAVYVNEEGNIAPVKSRHSMYAYLPMIETRFPFPIYLNADFILSSNREGIQSDNVWNHFLMYHLGRNYVKFISQVASVKHEHYLSLMLGKYFDAVDKDMEDLAHYFNKGYAEALATDSFIINDKNVRVKQSEILYDLTGLSAIISCDEFCFLVNEKNRRLPHPALDSSILKSEVFADISRISSIKEQLLQKSILKYIRKWMSSADQTQRDMAFEWLVKQDDSELIKKLPLFSFAGRYRSIEDIIESKRYLFLHTSLSCVRHILCKLGFVCSDGDIQSHPLYKPYLSDNILSGYKSRAISLIVSKSQELSDKLTPEDKVLLYQTIAQRCSTDKLQNELRTWRLFNNTIGQSKELHKLMASGTDVDENSLFSSFIIDENEYQAMSIDLKNKMMSRDNIYEHSIVSDWGALVGAWCAIGSASHWTEKEYAKLYEIVQGHYKAYCVNHPDQKIQTISHKEDAEYILVGCSFKKRDEVFYSSKFTEVSLRNAALKLLDVEIPSSYALQYLGKEPFVTAPKNWTTQSHKEEVSLTDDELLAVVSFCDGNKENFFEKYIVISSENGVVVSSKGNNWQFYSADKIFADYVVANIATAKALPSVVNGFRKSSGVISEEDLYTKVFNEIDCQEQGVKLLNFVNTQSTNIKIEYLKSIGNISVSSESFDDDSYMSSLFKLCSLLFESSEVTDDNVTLQKQLFPSRDHVIIEYTSEDAQKKSQELVDIPLQGRVFTGQYSFDMDDLNPSGLQAFQKAARDVLTSMRKLGLSEDYLNALFELDAEISSKDVFDSLNDHHQLENGAQLAFVLRYMSNHRESTIKYSLEAIDGKSYHGSVIKHWYISSYPFIMEKRTLAVKYQDITKYISQEEFDKLPNGYKINSSADTFEFIKEELELKEILSLLDYMFSRYEEDVNYWSTNQAVENLLPILKISRDDIVVSQYYSLVDEGLPANIIAWVRSVSDLEKQNSRLDFIKNVFSLYGEDSDIVKFRKYLNGEIAEFNLDIVTSLLQTKACNWIRLKEIWLTESQYDYISSHFDKDKIQDIVDVDIINKQIQGTDAAVHINSFQVYKFDGIIPRYVYIASNPKYVCYKYQSGDYFVDNYRIIVSTNSWNSLEYILMSIASDSKTGFTSADFLKYMQQKGAMGGDSIKEKDILDEQLEATNNELRRLREVISNMNVDMASMDDSYRDLDPERKKEALLEARRAVCAHLRKQGFEVPEVENNSDDWTKISGVKKGADEYTVIVRSYRDSDTRNFELNPFDWVNLMKGNTMLWVYTKRGPECFPFKDLVKNKSRISLSFSTVNTDYVMRMNALAESLRYFNSVRFDFGPNLSRGHSTAERFMKPEQKLSEVLSPDDPKGMF